MPTAPTPDSHLVFGDFIESLKLRGFTVGVGHYLRLQKLLSRVGPECKPKDLKTLVCPIFATDEREQTCFYEQFDSWFGFDRVVEPQVEASEVARSVIEKQEDRIRPVDHRKKLAFVYGPVIVGLLGLGILLAFLPNSPVILGGDFSPTPTPTIAVATPTPPPLALFGQTLRVRTLLRFLAAILPLLLLALYYLRRLIRKRQNRNDWKNREQPGIPLAFRSSLANIYDTDFLTRVARLLRARQRSSSERLDIGATIAATVKALGYPTRRDKALSKPTEYLALIDRAAFRDHQSRLFHELSRRLHDESVFVTSYFFEGDPRVCFAAPFEPIAEAAVVLTAEEQRKLEEEQTRARRGVTLMDLHGLYPDHRLIIFGEGADLVDPVAMQTVEWVRSFSSWQERAVLAPRPPRQWGAHELALSQQFVVMPATLNGLELVAESFSIREPVNIPEAVRGDAMEPPHDIDSVEGLSELRTYLGGETFQWLCACAVHPQLQWDLTIHLGAEFSQTQSLLREENLLRLVSLPWFRAGAIPEQTRERLLKKLSAGSEAKVRQTIDELRVRAQTSPVVANSAEVIQIAVLQEDVDSLPEDVANRARNLRDSSFNRFLRPQRWILFLKKILPQWLQRLLFTPFGLRFSTSGLLAALLALAIWASFPTIASGLSSGAEPDPSPTPTASPDASPLPSPISTASPAASPLASSTPTVTPTPVVSTPSPFFPPSPTPFPTATILPSPVVVPSPVASPPSSPRPTPPPGTPSPTPAFHEAGILRFEIEPATISPGEQATLRFELSEATRVKISPSGPGLEALNKSFTAAGDRPVSTKNSVVIQPDKTTTYTIFAEDLVPKSPHRYYSRQATLTVRDTRAVGPVSNCRPLSVVILVVSPDNASKISLAVDKSCSSDGQASWGLDASFTAKGSRRPATYSYTAQTPNEAEALQALVQGGGSDAFARAVTSDLYPALRTTQSQKVLRAMKYILSVVK